MSLQVARNVEASCSFRDVGRQSAACDMASAACHSTLTSTLRDTLKEMLHPCDTTFRYDDKGWNILEGFDRTGYIFGLEPSLIQLPYRWIPISLHPLIFQEETTKTKVSAQYKWSQKIKHQLVGQSSCDLVS